ncbi:MAG: DUF4215 domain-containing protein [Pseudomonadota bacterium]
MNRKYWLLLSLAPFAAALSAACSSDFDSCEARRTCSAGGTGGVGAGEAGAGGAGAGEAGVEEGGNNAGSAGTSGSAAEGGSSGEGGSGGEGGALDVSPVLFEACSIKGEFACVGHASAQRLACDGKLWQAGTTCAAGELCDSSDGMCAAKVTECASAKPGAVVCRNDTPLACGPDLVTASEGKTCDGRCKLGVCQAPTCGDEKIEKGEECDNAEGNASGACAKCKTASCGDGVVYAAGQEQCDDGNKLSGDGCSATCRAEPVALALGVDMTCALSSTGLVKCWGRNDSGQLGLGDIINRGDTQDSVPSKLSAIDLGPGRKAKAISARGATACALLVDGDVKCWGNNYIGQLGTDDTANRGDGKGEMGDALKPISLGVGLKAIGVSAAASHTCVVLDAGSVKCWGSKEYGQLGQEHKLDVLSPKDLAPIKFAHPVIAVSASNYLFDGKGGKYGGATCALLDDGTVRCWGSTDGVPHTSSADVDSSYGIGDSPGEMSALPTLTLSGGIRANSIVAGSVSAAILDDGSLRLWGTGLQLGQPDLGSDQVGMTPANLAGLSALQIGEKKVKSLGLGKNHACAVLDGGLLKCWGDGYYGQLGLGATSSTNAPPSTIPAVDLGGSAALQVATGEFHTCAILANGTIKCWGSNTYGELGLGDTNSRGDKGSKLSDDTTVDLTF